MKHLPIYVNVRGLLYTHLGWFLIHVVCSFPFRASLVTLVHARLGWFLIHVVCSFPVKSQFGNFGSWILIKLWASYDLEFT